jgi:hypothetical protein
MKKIFVILAFGFLATGNMYAQGHGTNQQQVPEKPQSAINFKEQVYNFKEVEYASDVSHSFTFTNTSHAPITVKEVIPSCGCTTTDYTKGPIMPGKSGSISIKYDSSRIGYFAKSVSVKISEETFTLTFLGTVKPAKTDDNTPSQGH